MVGKGSLNHNSREFYASNVDPNRSHLNIEFCRRIYETSTMNCSMKHRKDSMVNDPK